MIAGFVVLAFVAQRRRSVLLLAEEAAVKTKPATVAVAGQAATTAVQAPPAQAMSAGQAINAALPGLSCSWIDTVGPVQNGSPVKLVTASDHRRQSWTL